MGLRPTVQDSNPEPKLPLFVPVPLAPILVGFSYGAGGFYMIEIFSLPAHAGERNVP